jgi:hypothetical protein
MNHVDFVAALAASGFFAAVYVLGVVIRVSEHLGANTQVATYC